ALRGVTAANAANDSGERFFLATTISSSAISSDINAMLNSSILAQGYGVTIGSSLISAVMFTIAVYLSSGTFGMMTRVDKYPTEVNRMVSPSCATNEKYPWWLAVTVWLLYERLVTDTYGTMTLVSALWITPLNCTSFFFCCAGNVDTAPTVNKIISMLRIILIAAQQ